MSLGRAAGVSLVGLNGHIIDVEADLGGGLPAFVLLGLPDASLIEARDRIRSAARNSGVPLCPRRITVNLTPASLPKRGSADSSGHCNRRFSISSIGFLNSSLLRGRSLSS